MNQQFFIFNLKKSNQQSYLINFTFIQALLAFDRGDIACKKYKKSQSYKITPILSN